MIFDLSTIQKNISKKINFNYSLTIQQIFLFDLKTILEKNFIIYIVFS